VRREADEVAPKRIAVGKEALQRIALSLKAPQIKTQFVVVVISLGFKGIAELDETQKGLHADSTQKSEYDAQKIGYVVQ